MADWTPTYRDEILSHAMRGPLSDLLPNLAHFGERVRELNAEAEARFLMRRRSWRAGEDFINRGYPVGGNRAAPARAGKVRR